MPVRVQFPDGVREVPSRTRIIPSREIPRGPDMLTEEPVPDSKWRFQPVIGGWIAIPRK